MNNKEDYIQLPVLPLRGLVVFPKMIIHFDVARQKSINAITKAMATNQTIFIAAQIDASKSDPSIEDLYTTGVVANVVQVLKKSEDMIRIVVDTKYRAAMRSHIPNRKYLLADIEPLPQLQIAPNTQEKALMRTVKRAFEQYLELTPKLPPDILFKVGLTENPSELADYIAGNIMLDYRVKQSILETSDPTDRLEFLLEILEDEVNILKIEEEINRKTQDNIAKNQRDYYLREQLNVIQDELGEDDSPAGEAEMYRDKIFSLKLPDTVEETLLKECDKLCKMPFGSHEATVIRNYLDCCLELPWNKSSKERIDLKKVRTALDKNHYGLNKVKERIIEQLAIKKLAPNAKGHIICLVGPPGVGKTSIAQSIAQAINRKSQRIALGGVHDEAEIRGHRKTYIGAMPGRIISAIKTAGVNNPLLILDEVDKLASDYKGDPTSALLEVLDAEQNSTFQDHYIDLPFDLSNVMFITTANDFSAIPAPLRDRMDVIELDSYTREEKFNIAKKHLLPKQLKNCGLTQKQLKISDKALYVLIDNYVKEAGVRSLERKIAEIIRKSAVQIVNGDTESAKITDKELEPMLGPKKYLGDELSKTDEIGLVNGLAWTSVGGEILPIEVAVMQGTGKIEITGSLGDVMQESARAAVTCIRSHSDALGISGDFYKNCDIHIHAPEGAVPKDGPSAGITMATAIYSALSAKPVRHDVAMTGEITLRGRVLPIGGLKEKSMAAYKNGMNTVIIPKRNYSDLADVDEIVKANVEFIPVETIKDVFKVVFAEAPIISKIEFNSVLLQPDIKSKVNQVTAQ